MYINLTIEAYKILYLTLFILRHCELSVNVSFTFLIQLVKNWRKNESVVFIFLLSRKHGLNCALWFNLNELLSIIKYAVNKDDTTKDKKATKRGGIHHESLVLED